MTKKIKTVIKIYFPVPIFNFADTLSEGTPPDLITGLRNAFIFKEFCFNTLNSIDLIRKNAWFFEFERFGQSYVS